MDATHEAAIRSTLPRPAARKEMAAEEVASHQAKDLEARVVHGDEITDEGVNADRRCRLEQELVVVCPLQVNENHARMFQQKPT